MFVRDGVICNLEVFNAQSFLASNLFPFSWHACSAGTLLLTSLINYGSPVWASSATNRASSFILVLNKGRSVSPLWVFTPLLPCFLKDLALACIYSLATSSLYSPPLTPFLSIINEDRFPPLEKPFATDFWHCSLVCWAPTTPHNVLLSFFVGSSLFAQPLNICIVQCSVFRHLISSLITNLLYFMQWNHIISWIELPTICCFQISITEHISLLNLRYI